MTKKKQIMSTKDQTMFLVGIILAALFGILGNVFVTSYYRFIDSPNFWTKIDFFTMLLIIVILFVLFSIMINHRFEKTS